MTVNAFQQISYDGNAALKMGATEAPPQPERVQEKKKASASAASASQSEADPKPKRHWKTAPVAVGTILLLAAFVVLILISYVVFDELSHLFLFCDRRAVEISQTHVCDVNRIIAHIILQHDIILLQDVLNIILAHHADRLSVLPHLLHCPLTHLFVEVPAVMSQVSLHFLRLVIVGVQRLSVFSFHNLNQFKKGVCPLLSTPQTS